ncbi:30S ribosomal protein S21 [candidate division WOR-3 bacterium]|nr:30S ribosomal protein S21 [candidate division WOR-3 bacterium]
MIRVEAQPGESFESLFRRFKRIIERDRILSEYKKHQVYEKPSEIRRKIKLKKEWERKKARLASKKP